MDSIPPPPATSRYVPVEPAPWHPGCLICLSMQQWNCTLIRSSKARSCLTHLANVTANSGASGKTCGKFLVARRIANWSLHQQVLLRACENHIASYGRQKKNWGFWGGKLPVGVPTWRMGSQLDGRSWLKIWNKWVILTAETNLGWSSKHRKTLPESSSLSIPTCSKKSNCTMPSSRSASWWNKIQIGMNSGLYGGSWYYQPKPCFIFWKTFKLIINVYCSVPQKLVR